MSEETHQAFVKRYFSDGVQRLIQNDRQALDEYFTHDYVSHTPMVHVETGAGRKELGEGLAHTGERAREIILEPDMIASAGDLVMVHWVAQADYHTQRRVRHAGEVDAPDAPYNSAGVTILRMRDGKIAESWQYDNHYDVLLSTGQLQIAKPTSSATS